MFHLFAVHLARGSPKLAWLELFGISAYKDNPDARLKHYGQRPCFKQIIAARSSMATIAVWLCLYGAGPRASAANTARDPSQPLRVAVYDLAPYGSVDATGLFSGVSVDLWRRVAEDLGVDYRFISVLQMDDVLAGLEHGRFDAAVGAITITPERLMRVDFSYPAHRSGVAVAFRRTTGPIAGVILYGQAVRQHI